MARSSSSERRLEIPKATLIQHAQDNYNKAKAAYSIELAEYGGRVEVAINESITKLETMLQKVLKVRGTTEKSAAAISKVINGNTERYSRKDVFEVIDPPSKSHVCTWKQRLDWLKAAKTETISMTEYEFSSYIQEEC